MNIENKMKEQNTKYYEALKVLIEGFKSNNIEPIEAVLVSFEWSVANLMKMGTSEETLHNYMKDIKKSLEK